MDGSTNLLPQTPARRRERGTELQTRTWEWAGVVGQGHGGGKTGLEEVSISSEPSSLKSMSLCFDLMIWSNMIVSFIPVYVLAVDLCTELNTPFINL